MFLFHKNSPDDSSRENAFTPVGRKRNNTRDDDQVRYSEYWKGLEMEEKESGILKRKGKGGRPLKKVKKENVMRVRLSDAEKFLIIEKAKKAGMKPSEWFRASAKKAVILARISPEDLALFRVLTGMANNLNQLTKQAHQVGLIVVVQSCQDLLVAIDKTLQHFSRD